MTISKDRWSHNIPDWMTWVGHQALVWSVMAFFFLMAIGLFGVLDGFLAKGLYASGFLVVLLTGRARIVGPEGGFLCWIGLGLILAGLAMTPDLAEKVKALEKGIPRAIASGSAGTGAPLSSIESGAPVF